MSLISYLFVSINILNKKNHTTSIAKNNELLLVTVSTYTLYILKKKTYKNPYLFWH